MKEGWSKSRIIDITRKMFAGGDVPKQAFSKCKTDVYTIPIYANGAENDGLYGYTNEAKVSEPAVTISGRGTIGYVSKRRTPFCPVVRLITLIPNEDIISLDYLYYALYALDYSHSGSSIPQLTVPMVKEIEVSYPCLCEQKRIVERLDAAFENIDKLKANAEKQLAEAQTLFQKSLAKAMEPKEGWEEMKLGEFAFMKAGDFIKASDIHEEFSEGLYPCYGGNGLRGYVKEPNQEGDYCLIGRQGALCGCINRASGVFRTTEHAVIVKPYKEIPTSLVYYLLTQLNLNKYATGAAQPGLSVNNIAEVVRISIPPAKDYQRIAERLDSLSENVRKYEEIQRQIISECDALKQALLRKVFE